MTGVLHQARRKQQKQREVVRRRREQIDLKGRKLLKDLEFLFDKKMGRLALRSVGGMLSGALKQEAERVQFLMGRLRANQITRWQYEILYDNHKAMLAVSGTLAWHWCHCWILMRSCRTCSKKWIAITASFSTGVRCNG
jgi:hypothetical protein